MNSTSIAFVCSLAGTLALLAVNGGYATYGASNQRAADGMLTYVIQPRHVERGANETPSRLRSAAVSTPTPTRVAGLSATIRVRDRH